MTQRIKKFNPREYMEMAVEVMKKSIQEPRKDKTSPKVGAVLVKTDGTFETAYRGEIRDGDHAEFTLLERKNRTNSLDGSVLFATLEPCAPGARRHPKLGCAERIVNARIKKVWVGVEDPDPLVDRKGIKYLIENGVEVEMFDADLQTEIWAENKKFKEEAEDRAKKRNDVEPKEVFLSDKELVEPKAELEDFSNESIDWFVQEANLNVKPGTDDFFKIFSKLGLIEKVGQKMIPTGIGLLLFGTDPQLIYQQAVIRATYKTSGRGEELTTVSGPLVMQPDQIQRWYESKIGSQIDRNKVQHKINYNFPLVVFRETIINAIVHRDYDIIGAPIYFEINDDAIIIKSPGEPVKPLKFDQIRTFSAPSLSRNPKIMYVFDQLKLVEQRGLGFQTIKELPKKFDLPLPIVTYEAPYMVITFYRSNDAIRNFSDIEELKYLNKEELKGYQWIANNIEVSTREYANNFDYGYKKAQRHLAKMKQLSLIEDNGLAATSPNYKYKLKVNLDK